MARLMKGRHPPLLRIFESMYGAYGPQHWWPVGGRRRPVRSNPSLGDSAAFEVMVGAILTQNTAWINVEKAIANLRRERVLKPKAIHRMPLWRLARLIRPAGYFNVKARRMKSFVNFFIGSYGGDIRGMLKEDPGRLRQKLLSVKGIGPETADSILLYALGLPWFVVDAYTRRVFSRHGMVGREAGYGELQKLFMNNLRQDPNLFNEYHALIVKLGKEVCRPKPMCEQCPLLETLGEPRFIT